MISMCLERASVSRRILGPRTERGWAKYSARRRTICEPEKMDGLPAGQGFERSVGGPQYIDPLALDKAWQELFLGTCSVAHRRSSRRRGRAADRDGGTTTIKKKHDCEGSAYTTASEQRGRGGRSREWKRAEAFRTSPILAGRWRLERI